MTPPARLLIAALRLYQWTIRPLIPGCCRFEPGCSEYAAGALRIHGSARGSALAAWRVLRCNPFCAGGYDPVPPCRCEGSKQDWALPRPAKGQGPSETHLSSKWILEACPERTLEALPPGGGVLALRPSQAAPLPSLRRSPV